MPRTLYIDVKSNILETSHCQTSSQFQESYSIDKRGNLDNGGFNSSHNRDYFNLLHQTEKRWNTEVRQSSNQQKGIMQSVTVTLYNMPPMNSLNDDYY